MLVLCLAPRLHLISRRNASRTGPKRRQKRSRASDWFPEHCRLPKRAREWSGFPGRSA